MREQRLFLNIGLAFLLFNIYGSLLPFELEPLPLDDVIRKLWQIPYLNLGMYQRADWVANLLLYVPPAFFLSGWASGLRWGALAGWLIPFLVCITVFVSIEIAQIVFPQRTVSLNDLIAEFFGTVLGIVAWQVGGSRFVGLWRAIAAGGHPAIRAALLAYAVLYFLLAFFPFDFVVSGAELAEKLEGGSVNLVAAQGIPPLLRFVRLLAEIAVALPFGVLLALEYTPWTQRRWMLAALWGLALGAITELVQLFLVSGIVQGISVATRLCGVMLGVAVVVFVQRRSWTPSILALKLGVVLFVTPYLYVLLKLNHWFESGLVPLEDALGKLEKLSFIPFYYHYFTTEVMAMQSLLLVAASYVPIGAGVWVYQGMPWRPRGRVILIFAVFFISLVVESGKLFFAGARPDTTNCLIAAVSAGLFYSLCCWVRRWLLHPEEHLPATASQLTTSEGELSPSRGLPLFFGLATVVWAFWFLSRFPVASVFLIAGLAVYVVVLWLFPRYWPAYLLAAVPVLDLTPWSGRIFFNEFDVFVLVTLVIAWVRGPRPVDARHRAPGSIIFLLSVFCLLEAVAFFRGLLPLNGELFAHYFNGWNALRIEKGLLWAGVALVLLRRYGYSARAAFAQLTLGMSVGLGLAIITVTLERYLFVGLSDYDADYRPAGLFSSMHTGDAYLDAFLLLALPFTLAVFFYRRSIWMKAASVGLLLLGVYTVLLTYTRSDYAALVAGALIIVLLHLLRADSLSRKFRVVSSTFLLSVFVAGLIGVVWSGDFVKSRFATVERGAIERMDHWQDTLAILDTGLESRLFGRGLGSFPGTYFLTGPEGAGLASYQFIEEDDNTFLRLGGGSRVYVGQRLGEAVSGPLHVTLTLRQPDFAVDNGALRFILCEKAIQHSFNCTSQSLSPVPGSGWQAAATELLPESPLGVSGRPVELALINTRPDTLVDIDNLVVRDGDGQMVMTNGDFEQGIDHWFMSSDSHFAWHPFNIAVYLLFERGWLGFLVWLILLGVVGYRLVKLNRADAPHAPILAGALAGFLVLGLWNTLIDDPRILFIFSLLAGWVLVAQSEKEARLARN